MQKPILLGRLLGLTCAAQTTIYHTTGTGVNCTNGLNGAQGIPGVNGTNGLDGAQGPQGLPGINGTNGVNGLNGLSGSSFIVSNLVRTVLGAGSGSTNYVLEVFTNSANEFVLGSSNVLISAVRGTVAGAVIRWSAYITNLSAINWGISFSSVTNRWLFLSPAGGTNSPAVFTNNTRLELLGRSDGTNTMVRWAFYRPGL